MLYVPSHLIFFVLLFELRWVYRFSFCYMRDVSVCVWDSLLSHVTSHEMKKSLLRLKHTNKQINKQDDSRISAKSIAEQLDISRERVGSTILDDLDMRKLSVKRVRKCLNTDQKHQRCHWCDHNLEFFRRNPKNLSQLVTIEETWLYQYDPETKQQSMEWRHSGSPRPK